jgi:hypothetical protein
MPSDRGLLADVMKMHLTPAQPVSRLGISTPPFRRVREYSFHAPGVALHFLGVQRDIDYLKESRSLVFHIWVI